MAVYIDDCKLEYGRMLMSHMWSPDIDELNAMADKIGIKRKWLQLPKNGRDYFTHYDVCQSKRELAIENGAIPISVKQLVKMVSPNFEYTEHDLQKELNGDKQLELV